VVVVVVVGLPLGGEFGGLDGPKPTFAIRKRCDE
jgi:hypothetical protein